MNAETPRRVADILGVLAITGVVAAVGLVIAAVVPSLRSRVIEPLRGTAMYLAGGVALTAMAGSLWFSEAAGFPPCKLCVYQRYAMYPLVVVLPLAAWRRSRVGRRIALGLVTAGLAVNTWHNVIETFPDLETGGSCAVDNPCSLRWVEGLGFWTIPRLATVCFVLIAILTLIDRIPKAAEPS